MNGMFILASALSKQSHHQGQYKYPVQWTFYILITITNFIPVITEINNIYTKYYI